MKRRLIQFVTTYFLFVLIFVLQKPIFMGYYHTLHNKVSWTDYFSAIGYGLPLDLSLAGYLTAIPELLLIASVWIQPSTIRQICRVYFIIIAILLSYIFIGDLGLYEYWGFRLDATPLFCLFSSPKSTLANVSIWIIIAGLTAVAVYAALLYWIFYWVLIYQKQPPKIPFHRLSVSGVLLSVTGLLLAPIRGGFTVSIMNLSKAYFSSNQQPNHTAINPYFSLMESLSRQDNFDKQCRFMTAEEADKLFAELKDKPVTPSDSVPQLFTTERLNVVLIILESFSSKLMETLGGKPNVAISMDQFGREGVLLAHFFVNSFRTDHGLAAIISGYPAQPTINIMKYPKRTQHLPSILGSLKKAGYDLQYYYGGGADFTNMRSYLIQAGIDNIVSDKDFPLSERLSKWGVHDRVIFNRLLNDLEQNPPKEPFMKIVQASSSHEPFKVPFQWLDNPRLNAFAYVDSCAGDFVRWFKETPLWKNTVIILVPDHLGAYPQDINNLTVDCYRIPLIFIGGAVKGPKHIDTYGSQIDITITLLGQLGLPHGEFAFNKNMLNPASPHFGFFTFSNAFGMMTPENEVIFNCESNSVVSDEGEHERESLPKARAYLQKLYGDLAKR